MEANRNWTIEQDKHTGIFEINYLNGLKALVFEKHSLPTVSTMIWYRVGSADSTTGKTGFAHLIEHLMFKGTHTLKKGEIDSITQKLGGSNNAFTSSDYTCYFFNFRSDRWLKALEIESDRMLHCTFDEKEFESEKKVILEELASSLDSNFSILAHEAESAFFKIHPYRNPILGWRQDIECASLNDVKEYYKQYYMPNNCFLVITGDVKAHEVAKNIYNYFGHIPSGTIKKRSVVSEPLCEVQRRITLYQDVEIPRFLYLLPTCKSGTYEDYVLDIIDIIVSFGKTSRLYRKLIYEDNLVQNVSTINDTRKDLGVFWISGELYPGNSTREVENRIAKELAKLRTYPVGKYELEKAKNIFFSSFIFHQETAYDMAEKIGIYEIFGSYKELEAIEKQIHSISSADVLRIARTYFHQDRSLIAWSLPKGYKEKKKSCKKKTSSLKGIKIPNIKPRKITFMPGEGVKKNDGKLDVKKYIYSNGLTLLALENHSMPSVSIKLYTKGLLGAERPEEEGYAYLLSRLILEGTENKTSQQISQMLEYIGGSLFSRLNGISAKVLSQDLEFTLEIISDAIQNPLLDTEILKQKKEKILAEIISRREEASYHAGLAYRKIIYGNHPYGKPIYGTENSIKNTTRRNLLLFHRKHFLPNQTIISVVGDIKPDKVHAIIGKIFGKWKTGKVRDTIQEKIKAPGKSITKYIPLDKKQLLVYSGHLGIKRTNPDYYKLLVLDQIFGQGDGFTDRLSRRIRDELGLCYSVEASIAADAGMFPGTFTASLATSPQNYSLAMKILKEEICKIQKEPIKRDELENAKSYLSGSFVFSFEDNDSLSSHIINAYRYNLHFDYIKKFPGIIEKITGEQVREVAMKYLYPNSITTVVVGPVKKIKK